MAAQPPTQPGQLSADGAWRWDGQRWVPTGAASPAAAPRQGSLRWLWFVGAGCGVLIVLVAALVVFGGVQLAQRFQQGAFSCLPSDFPRYPGATVTRDNTSFGTAVAPGDTRECQESLTSQDDVATVTLFYEQQLAGGDWTITNDDKANGRIDFARRSRPQTVGTVELLGQGRHAQIEVRLDS